MFLGHVVSDEGIHVDLKKVEAILDWKQSKNVYKIQSFPSLVRYYQRFIKGFSLIVALLGKLLRKNTPFKWIDL